MTHTNREQPMNDFALNTLVETQEYLQDRLEKIKAIQEEFEADLKQVLADYHEAKQDLADVNAAIELIKAYMEGITE
jgi:septation ring formation regulator EzrA